MHEFLIALDGVYENPSWTFEFGFDPKMGEAIGAITGTCRAILLGRRTFEMFAPAWSPRTAEEDPGTPFFNESPKYARRWLPPGAEWNNSTILGPYHADTIRGLKDKVDGDLYVSGSGTLVRAMLADGLVTNCTCSSTRSHAAKASACSPMAVRPRSSPWPDPRPTATGLCISVTPPADGLNQTRNPLRGRGLKG